MSTWRFNSGVPAADCNRAPVMLYARYLRISHINNRDHWMWVRQTDSRFMEAAELQSVWWLQITATIKFSELTGDTNYTAHLIFKTTQNSRGLDTVQEASVVYSNMTCNTVVCINPRVATPRNKCIGLPVRRSDGWMELEIARFYCDDGPGDQEAVMTLKEKDDEKEKSGLVVAGIELRPF